MVLSHCKGLQATITGLGSEMMNETHQLWATEQHQLTGDAKQGLLTKILKTCSNADQIAHDSTLKA